MRSRKVQRNRAIKWGVALLTSVGLLTGCNGAISAVQEKKTAEETKAGEIPSASQDIFAMDTYMTVTAYGEQAQEAVSASVDEINRLDQLFSTEKEESEIYIVNHNGSEILSEDTAALLEKALAISKDTDGLFDISIYPLMVEWGFTSQKYQIPTKEKMQKLLEQVDYTKLQYDKETKLLALSGEMQIDLGGIAKGYTSGRIMDIFQDYGIQSGMVSLGGNVQVYGTKTDGNPWRVAIRDPNTEEESAYAGVLETQDQAVITSGGYERYFEMDNQIWHHILDPRTGYPADNGLTSVTVVSGDGTLADGLSTSLFIMGKEKALEYWRKHVTEFDMILIEQDGSITVTEDLDQRFTSDHSYKVAKK